MTKLPKTLLTISLTGFAIGFVGVCGGPNMPMFLYVGMPVGAIFLGGFLIARAFDEEMIRYDEETRQRIASLERFQRSAPASNRITDTHLDRPATASS